MKIANLSVYQLDKVTNYVNRLKTANKNQIANIKLKAAKHASEWISKKANEISRVFD